MSFMEIIFGALATIAAAALGVWGVSIANKHQKGMREDRLIDQLQEEVVKLREDQKQSKLDHTADFRELKARVLKSEKRDQTYLPYIFALHRHIELKLGPPAPALPQLVQDYLDERN